jgi:ABC-type polysaccharide/polyol phosphate transport system ATPase subunit
MTDVVIHAIDLKKTYRLYAKPSYRFLDMFGLLGRKVGAYTEHAALDGVTFDIRRGEKVAIIGRNGAGKSTLLKLVTNVIQPTSGVLDVRGHAHALLQIGTGFHPDFTGRQNVHAYLAQLGIRGSEADRRCLEVVEFSEIEEYIDQPVKTYSTGMAVRLMFSVSTAITPDLLVLDEVLGVGDAYFAHKSYGRIRELCDREGTTLLLVTHDVYSAAKICDRMIWIDRGQVMADLEPAETLKLYENSVRLQEEQRLRAKAVNRARQSDNSMPNAGDLILEFSVRTPPMAGPIYFSAIELSRNGQTLGRAPLAEAASGSASLVTSGMAWGDVIEWQGKRARMMRHFGSPFHKVGVLFRGDDLEAGLPTKQLAIKIEYGGPVEVAVDAIAYLNGRTISLGTLTVSPTGWSCYQKSLDSEDRGNDVIAPTSANIGTGAIVIGSARLIDEYGQESLILKHGRPATFEFDFRVADPDLAGPVGVGIAVLRNGVETACRFFAPDLVFDGRNAPCGTVSISVPENWLGTGSYSITVMLTRAGYADRTDHVFFSINPDVYACVRDVLEFQVLGGNLFATGTPLLARGNWSVRATPLTSRTD